MPDMQHLEEFKKIVETHYPALTKSQKQVARSILADLSLVSTHNALQVAQIAGVSDATVIRFCSAIGFAGYADLQKRLRKLFFSGRYLQRLEKSSQPADDQDALQAHAAVHKGIIDATCETLSRPDFEQAVSMIQKASQVYVLALRSLYSASFFLGNMLRLFFGKGEVLSLNEGYGYEKMTVIGPDDLLIGMSFERYTRHTAELLRFGKARGAGVIAIVDSPLAPLCETADVKLVVVSESGEAYDSLIGLMHLIETLLSVLVSRSQDTVKRNLDFFEKSIAPHIYIE